MSHDVQIEYDIKRTVYLEKAGYKVFRVSNQDVCSHAAAIVETILSLVETT